jgi:mannose-6-phosphate isomerase-like protein (cupin superfamily)
MPLTEGRTWASPDGAATIEIAANGADAFVFDRRFRPHSGKAGPHRHLDYEERYEILEGRARAKVDGTEHELAAGDELVIPRGAAHLNPYNDTDAPMRFRQTIEPSLPFADIYLATAGDALERGRLTKQDELPLPAVFLVIAASGGQSYAAGIPIALQKAMLPLLKLVGRARGYRAIVP